MLLDYWKRKPKFVINHLTPDAILRGHPVSFKVNHSLLVQIIS